MSSEKLERARQSVQQSEQYTGCGAELNMMRTALHLLFDVVESQQQAIDELTARNGEDDDDS